MKSHVFGPAKALVSSQVEIEKGENKETLVAKIWRQNLSTDLRPSVSYMRQHLKSDVDLTVILRLSAPRKPKDSNMRKSDVRLTLIWLLGKVLGQIY